jgi:hypothetical protein
LECNCVKNNRVGVYHYRKYLDRDGENGDNLATENNLESNRVDNVRHGWGPHDTGGEDVPGIVWGHSSSAGGMGGGFNRLEQGEGDLAFNVHVVPPDSNRTDLAHGNSWFDAAGSLLTTQAAIDSTIDIDWPNYNISVESDSAITDTSSANGICSYGAANCPDPPSPPSTSSALAGGPRKGRVPPREDLSTGLDSAAGLPERFALSVPRPNPSRGLVGVALEVPWWNTDRISLTIYDVAGRRVRTLADGTIVPGRHVVRWDRRDGSGDAVAAGIYVLRMKAGVRTETAKIVVLR